MKRTWVQLLFISAAATVCLLWMAGCGELSESYESGNSTAQTLQPTPTLTATPEPTPTPVATPSQPISTLPPGIREEARFYADLDGDGIDEAIILSSAEDSETIYLGTPYAGGYNQTVIDHGWFQSAFMTHTDGGDVCLLVSIDLASEDYITYIYAFDGLEPILQRDVGAYVYSVEGIDVTMSDMADAIGSWEYTCDFKLNDDFSLERLSDMKIVKNWREPLLTIRELPVEMLVEGVYIAGALPVGVTVYPVSTDGRSYLCFRLDDGSAGRINFTRDDSYETFIDGISEYDYFEHVEYSD